MKKIELLSPVGNKESLLAALYGGCDAVYLGGYLFGARNFAGNFSDEELIEAIELCHLYGVKVYVTVNTLVYEEEITMFLNYIAFLHRNQVDAVIMQDLGMMDLVRKTYPDLEIHASTQMHIHNLDGVLFAKKQGLKRAVIARETPLTEIRKIRSEVDLPLEVFVHGALCVSYSGQCLMSSLIGGRSGNRGTCAQCCRQPYDLVIDGKKQNKEKYLLSMRDLNTLDSIGELIDAGIDSVKIEGRMKRPEYVYLVTSLYRKAIDYYIETGKSFSSAEAEIELEKIFNRTFTKGYLFDEINSKLTNSYRPNHMGIEIGTVVGYEKGMAKVQLSNPVVQQDGIRILGTEDYGCQLNKIEVKGKLVREGRVGEIICFMVKEPVVVGSKVVKTTDVEQLERIGKAFLEKRRVSIRGRIVLKIGTPVMLYLSDGQNEICVEGDLCEQASSKPITEDNVRNQLSKVGDTVYQLEELKIELDDSLFIPLKSLNEIRRKGTEALNKVRLGVSTVQKQDYTVKVPNFSTSTQFHATIYRGQDCEEVKKLPLSHLYVWEEIYKSVNNDPQFILKCDRVMQAYPQENSLMMVGEVGGLNQGEMVETDWSMNVTNSYTIAFLHSLGVKKVTLSYELKKEQIETMLKNYVNRYGVNPNVEVVLCGRIEAMITKLDLLNSRGETGSLIDSYHYSYPVVQRNKKTIIYHHQPFSISDWKAYEKMGINNFRFDLLEETDVQFMKKIMNQIAVNKKRLK